MKNVVAYYRLSKESKNKKNYGLDAQKLTVHHFYSDRLVKEFEEIESGGSMDSRTQLKAAIEYCVKNNCYLTVAKVDRLSRNTEDVLAIYKQLKNRLYCCDLPDVNKFTLTIYAAIADRELELIRLRVKAGLDVARKAGKKFGNPNAAAEGKKSIKAAHEANRQKALNNPNSIKAGGYICTLYKAGATFSQIADILNSEGFITSRGGTFYPASVQQLYKRYCK